jgi:hypothetical protein
VANGYILDTNKGDTQMEITVKFNRATGFWAVQANNQTAFTAKARNEANHYAITLAEKASGALGCAAKLTIARRAFA